MRVIIITFLQYLWGIETKNIHHQIFIYFPFLQYLWGIETDITRKQKIYWDKFYSTYEELKQIRRGGNLCLHPSFYSTYEELKPPIKYKVPLTVCFYSTYEELKLNKNKNIILTALSFYSTYEELKLPPAKAFQLRRNKVFTVPMRNWNNIVPAEDNQISIVFTVPMRNWNKPTSLACT